MNLEGLGRFTPKHEKPKDPNIEVGEITDPAAIEAILKQLQAKQQEASAVALENAKDALEGTEKGPRRLNS